jgi:hypothetical protein
MFLHVWCNCHCHWKITRCNQTISLVTSNYSPVQLQSFSSYSDRTLKYYLYHIHHLFRSLISQLLSCLMIWYLVVGFYGYDQCSDIQTNTVSYTYIRTTALLSSIHHQGWPMFSTETQPQKPIKIWQLPFVLFSLISTKLLISPPSWNSY